MFIQISIWMVLMDIWLSLHWPGWVKQRQWQSQPPNSFPVRISFIFSGTWYVYKCHIIEFHAIYVREANRNSVTLLEKKALHYRNHTIPCFCSLTHPRHWYISASAAFNFYRLSFICLLKGCKLHERAILHSASCMVWLYSRRGSVFVNRSVCT